MIAINNKTNTQTTTTRTNNNQPEEQWYNKYQKVRSHGSLIYTWSVSSAKKIRDDARKIRAKDFPYLALFGHFNDSISDQISAIPSS
jgi:hypothetical protein